MRYSTLYITQSSACHKCMQQCVFHECRIHVSPHLPKSCYISIMKLFNFKSEQFKHDTKCMPYPLHYKASALYDKYVKVYLCNISVLLKSISLLKCSSLPIWWTFPRLNRTEFVFFRKESSSIIFWLRHMVYEMLFDQHRCIPNSEYW